MSGQKSDEIDNSLEYKEVMLGPKSITVPVSWDVKKFSSSDVAKKIKAGGTPTASNDEFYSGDIKYVKIEDMTAAGKFIYQTKTLLTQEGLESSSTWLVPENSLLLSMYGSYGKVAITADKVATNQAILGIIPSESIDLDYLFYAASRLKPYFKSVVLETTQANLNKGIVNNTPLLIPPLPEQQRIADILSTVDEQIQQTTEIIEKTEELRQGLSRDLVLGQGLAEEYTEARLGSKRVQIPSDWDIRTFSDIATVEKGNTPKTSNDDYYGGSIVWVTPDDLSTLYERGEKYISDSRRKITDAGLQSTSVNIVPAPSVVFTSRSYGIGKTAICTVPAASNQGIIAFHCEDELREEYHYYYLNYIMDYIIALSGVSTFPEASLTDVRNLRVPVPPEDDQRKIEDVLTSVDDKLVQERERKENLQDLKRGLMQDLLTGQRRVDA